MSTSSENNTVAAMALYNMERARKRISALEGKAEWRPEDTASFDCMHYLGDEALHIAARALDLAPSDHVLDIGSGFSATGRFLHAHYGADVTGVELQPEIHALAETITARNGMAAHVRSVNQDITRLVQTMRDKEKGQESCPSSFDHIVSFLCILHIPDRAGVFDTAAALLRPGGTIYIEDIFARRGGDGAISEETRRCLRDAVSCPYLPSRDRYIADLEAAGFGQVQFQDVTDEWAAYVHARAVGYHKEAEKPEPLLQTFYDKIDGLFAGGEIGGARIIAKKM